MFKRRLNGKMLALLGVMILAVCVSAFAGFRDGSWEVNPAAFRYDMSLYFRLADKDFEDLDKYEIGAFVGDECRGLAEKLELAEGESCLYMRIRSNQAADEVVDFLLRDRQTGDTVILKPRDGSDFVFKSGARVGTPSDPFLMARFFNVTVKTEGHGSVQFADGLYAAGTVLDIKAVPEEGYHLDSWSDGSKDETLSLTVEADTDLTATFAANVYKVVFTIDGQEIGTVDVAYGEPITAPEAPAKPGYTFGGWIDLPETMPAGDIQITGTYTVNSYKLTFMVDNEVVYSADVEYDSTITAPADPVKEGYTFNGWGELPAVMPAHDVEMHGSFTVNSYRLVFELDGQEFSSYDVAFGSAIMAPEAPVKEGYTFAGWADLPASMPASDLTVKGSYTVNSYKLVFKVDGEEISSATVEYGSPVSAPTTPEKVGYTFGGWGELPATMPAHDVEVHGTFTVNYYKLTFMLDGVELSSTDVAYGTPIVAPTVPSKDGYDFAGWGEMPETMPAGDLQVVGTYKVKTYVVTFRIDNEVILTSELEFGASINAPETPAKEGHTFAGWSEFPSTMPAHNVDVIGSYTINNYHIAFVIDGETIEDIELPFGSSIVAPEAPAKEGHTFSGWGEIPASMPAGDLTVTGSYLINKYRLSFRIGEELLQASEVEYGTVIVAPEVPAKEGYSFSGWSDFPETMPAADVQVIGAYNVNHYTITFKIDGEVFSSESHAYGASIIAPDAPVKEGYSFSGWGEVPSTIPASDVEFSGSYSANTYKLTFRIGEEVVLASELEYGAAISAPEAPAKEGYVFAGWSEHPAVMPAYDLEVSGSYNVNVYTITFSIDGNVLASESLAYGASIVAPEAPAREGYSFSGWGEVPASMPAADLAFEGSYSANTYNVAYIADGETLYSAQVAFGEKVPEFEAPAREGHSFSGWGEIPATMPAADLVFSGSYSVNSYSLVFRIDGEVVFEGMMPYGSDIVVPEAPAKEGYSFLGWKDVPASMPARDVVVESAYSVNTYTVTFKIGEEVFYIAQLEYGAPIEAPDAPVLEGQAFSGWGDVPATMPAFDLVFGGTYAENFYTVTFRIDGVVLFTDDVEYGDPISVPDAPEREGYSFNGWGEVPESMPAYNLEFDGSYNVNTYAISFRIGDDVIYSGVLPYGAEIVAPDVAAKEGHSFSGWGVVPPTMPASDLEVTGSYVVNSYGVTFMIYGVAFHSIQVPYGSEISAPEAPAKEGYSFVGWGNIPASMPAADLVIDGTYSVNSYAVTFRIDEEVIFSGQIPYGAEVVAPEAPAREGYTFSGWGMVPSVMPAYDVEVTGSYDINVYALTFLIDGAAFYSAQVPFGASIAAPEAPAKEGHSFIGWADMPATMPASDFIVSGSYAVNSYNVVFRIGDEIIFEGAMPYGSEIVAPEAPAKEGYTFAGWGMVPATMPASDIEVIGSYDANMYHLTFSIDGVDFYTAQLPYGAEIVAPAAPEKEGHSFIGWADVPAVMPASDLVISGNYSVNCYKAVFRIDDVVVFEGELPYGSEIVAPAAPAKEGYSFAGWGMMPTVMPASDIEVVGSYNVNVYTLTFSIDGVDFYTAQVPYGSEIVAPEVPAKEGYSFIGWNDVPGVMPASDLTLAGAYTLNSYKVLFRIGDEVIYEGLVPYDTEIITPAAPVKEGHTFAGWGMVPALMPASDLEFVGSYDVNVYTLTYRIDGVDFYTTQIAYGSELPAVEAPAKEGHSFLGWSDGVTVMPASDLVISGTYAINNYAISFSIGDEVVFSGVLPYGAEIVVPAAPVKEGHSFTGWGMVPEVMPASDLAFVGSYDVNVYTLTFDIDGEVFYQTQLAYGTEIVAPAEVPDKEGNSFGGWGNVPATMPANDVTVSGTYAANHYSVTFRIGDEIVFTGEQPFGSEIIVPAAPEKEGYMFSGWGDVPATVPASNLEFVGTYNANEYQLSFFVDGVEVSSSKVAYGASIEIPAVDDKEGYSFSGFGVVPAEMPASDLAFHGIYEVNYYNVVFKVGEEVIYSASVPFGGDVVAPAAPEKEGYTFVSWGEVPAVMPASDLSFEGEYSVNEYNLTFRLGDEVIYSEKIPFGAEIVAPEVSEKEGYSFGGWGVVPATMPANDVEISGVYDVLYYSLVFSIGEEVVYSAMLPYGAEIVAPAAPEKEGFAFSGWGDVPAVMPAHDLAFAGSYGAETYSITFRIGDEVIFAGSLEFGAEIVAPEAPAKEGHTFTGWGVVPAVMPASDLVFTGAYDVNSYSLVFRIGEEVLVAAQVPYGSEIIVPEAPAREGHTFLGWGNVPATMPASDLEFIGAYDTDKYQLTFLIGDEVIQTQEVSFGDAITAPDAPAKEGHTFTGWGVVPAVMPASDLVFTGTYELNSYSLVFRIGEEVLVAAQVTYGAEIVVPEAPAKEGHTFSGWGEVPATMPAANLEFSGSYTVNRYKLSFMIGEETIYSAEVAFGESITAPEAPAKEGHTFTGWGVVPATMPSSDLVITGSYDINYYSIVFRIGEEVFNSLQLPYGAEIVAPEAPAKEGHTFTGWGEVPATMPAGDLEFNGVYDVNYYNVVFRVDGQLISEAKIAFGSAIEVPAVAEKTGYTFSGFGVVPAVMPASDLEFNGKFEINYYTVTFKINDNVAFTAQLSYGAPIVAPAAPEQEGFTFSGWSEYPESMPANDVEVTGKLTANIYTLTVYVNDEIYMQEQLPYGAEISITEPTVDDDYIFKGWDIEIPATMPAHDLVIYGVVEKRPTVGVDGLEADQEVSIYSVDGILLHKNVKVGEIQERLTPGVYIVNGQKMIIK